MFLGLRKTSENKSKAKALAARCSAETFYRLRKKRRIEMGVLDSARMVESLSNKPCLKVAEGTVEGREFPKLHNLILIHIDLKRTLSNIFQSLTRITTIEK
jgi:hypothetical protein